MAFFSFAQKRKKKKPGISGFLGGDLMFKTFGKVITRESAI